MEFQNISMMKLKLWGVTSWILRNGEVQNRMQLGSRKPKKSERKWSQIEEGTDKLKYSQNFRMKITGKIFKKKNSSKMINAVKILIIVIAMNAGLKFWGVTSWILRNGEVQNRMQLGSRKPKEAERKWSQREEGADKLKYSQNFRMKITGEKN